MAGKAKDLNIQVRLQKRTVDECQKALGALQKREDELIMAGEAMDAQLVREQDVVRADPGGLAATTFAAFAIAHKKRRQHLNAQIAALRQEIEKARDGLSEAFRSLKATEQVQQTRHSAEQAEIAKKERDMLDEIGQNQYLRRLLAEQQREPQD